MVDLWLQVRQWVRRRHETILTVVAAPFIIVLGLIGWVIMVALIVAAMYLVFPFILGV